jgi:hypothetical protein
MRYGPWVGPAGFMAGRPAMTETKQHMLRIPMPWKGTYYSINWDEMRRGRKIYVIAWFKEFSCLFLRAGWSYRFDKQPEVENYSTDTDPERTV